MKIPIDALREKIIDQFKNANYWIDIAESMTKALLRSEMFGKDTHGIIRIPWIINKNIPNAYDIQESYITKNITIVDCTQSNGYVCAQKEIEKSIRYLQTHKQWRLSILKNIFPTNVLIDYLEQLYFHRMGAIICTTTPYLVWCEWSGDKILGTNPIWYTFPSDGIPILVDFSTSNIAFWKILKEYQSLSKKFVINSQGERDIPKNVFHNHEFLWALLPFGWIDGEHKWFAISLLVECITALLAWNRSKNGDMIIFSFHPSSCWFQQNGIHEVIQKIGNAKNIRIPWQRSYQKYLQSRKNGYIQCDETDFYNIFSQWKR